MEVHALTRRGWSISAIARHLGRDRKTVRAHLLGERVPGQRAAAAAIVWGVWGNERPGGCDDRSSAR